MRGKNSFLIIITSKGSKQASKKAENLHSKRQNLESKGRFPALYVIIKVSPLPPWTCTLHPTFTEEGVVAVKAIFDEELKFTDSEERKKFDSTASVV